MYKIIACDLDETLLKDDRTVSPSDLDAIQRARELGIKFVPATGRGYASVNKTLKELGLFDKEEEYVISYNGGIITENKNNRVLHFEGISYELASALYQKGKQYDVCIHVYTEDAVYVYGLVPQEKEYLEGRMEIIETTQETLEFLKGQDIIKVLYMNTDAAYLRQIEAELHELASCADVSYSSNRYLEFNRRGVNKGAGLCTLAKLLQVDIKDTIAIGDNINDLSMIQAAGLGIAVHNAVAEVKAHCDHITAATNNEGAIAEIIDTFIFQKP